MYHLKGEVKAPGMEMKLEDEFSGKLVLIFLI